MGNSVLVAVQDTVRVPRRAPVPVHHLEPVLDVVVPVFDEETDLEPSVRRLHTHLRETFPYPFRITVADNASTDGTPRIAARLAEELPEVRVAPAGRKGRGRALRAAWSRSPAPVLAYMDVDLSTDLAALLPLVAPLISGHSDIAIGTRLAPGSRVVRGAQTGDHLPLLQRLLRSTLAVGFSDAQCGFKAVRRDVAERLLPLVRGLGVVLRHRTAGDRRAGRAAHPRGAGRLGGRSRQPGRPRVHRAGRPARHRPDRPGAGPWQAPAGGLTARGAAGRRARQPWSPSCRASPPSVR